MPSTRHRGPRRRQEFAAAAYTSARRNAVDARFPLIPREEYISRLRRIREELASREIDLLILTGNSNLRYFGGYDPNTWSIPDYYYVLLLPRDSQIDPIILTAEPYQAGAGMSWVSDVRTWPLGKNAFMEDTSPAMDMV